MHGLLEIETRVLADLDPQAGKRAHFWAIATYQLQRPSRLNAEAVNGLRESVQRMLETPTSIDHLRREVGRRVEGKRKVSRAAAPGDHSHVDPRWPRTWTTTALDIVTAGDDSYVENVTRWAVTTTRDLALKLDG